MPPLRRRSRTESSSSENRQLRIAPSAVRRSRLQVPQNGWVTDRDEADLALAVGEAESLGRRGAAGCRLGLERPARRRCARRSRRPGTSWSRSHWPVGVEGHELDEAHDAPGLAGEGARSRGSRRRSDPRRITTFTLSGTSPAASAASIAASTVARSPRRRMAAKRSGRSESQLMFTRVAPRRRGAARAGRAACRSSSWPDRRSRWRESRATSAGRSLRTSGSPPVRRSAVIPEVEWRPRRPARSRRSVSSAERGRNVMPSSACSRRSADCSGRSPRFAGRRGPGRSGRRADPRGASREGVA